MAAMDQLSPMVGTKQACQALAVPRASWYRRRRRRLSPPSGAAQRHSTRALSESEQSTVLACLHEERFQDCSPAQVYAALLDQGRYHCSIRTMYRLLEAGGQSRERQIAVAVQVSGPSLFAAKGELAPLDLAWPQPYGR